MRSSRSCSIRGQVMRALRHVTPPTTASPTLSSSALGSAPRRTAETPLALKAGASMRSAVSVICWPKAGKPSKAPATTHQRPRAVISGRKYPGGQITVAAVADDEDDHGIGDLRRDVQRRPQRAARGNAGEYAFLAREPAHRVLGIGLGDLDHAVHAAPVANFRQIL